MSIYARRVVRDAHTQATTTFRNLGDHHREGRAMWAWAVAHNERWLWQDQAERPSAS